MTRSSVPNVRATATRTYTFLSEDLRRLDALAARLECFPGPVVQMILSRGLDEIEAGNWQVKRTPVMFRPVWD
jgi:hypothetical protein